MQQCAQKQNIAEYSNSGITQPTNPCNIEKMEILQLNTYNSVSNFQNIFQGYKQWWYMLFRSRNQSTR